MSEPSVTDSQSTLNGDGSSPGASASTSATTPPSETLSTPINGNKTDPDPADENATSNGADVVQDAEVSAKEGTAEGKVDGAGSLAASEPSEQDIVKLMSEVETSRKAATAALKRHGNFKDASNSIRMDQRATARMQSSLETQAEDMRVRLYKLDDKEWGLIEPKAFETVNASLEALNRALDALDLCEKEAAREADEAKEDHDVEESEDDTTEEKTTSKEEARPKTEEPSRKIAIPEIKKRSWEDWEKTSTSHTKQAHYAVEVLAEEANVGEGKKPLSGRRASQAVRRAQRAGNVLPTKPPAKSSTMPDRVRINSLPLKRMIFAIGASMDFKTDGCKNCAIVFLRPYKFLGYASREIREKFNEIKTLHDKAFVDEDIGDLQPNRDSVTTPTVTSPSTVENMESPLQDSLTMKSTTVVDATQTVDILENTTDETIDKSSTKVAEEEEAKVEKPPYDDDDVFTDKVDMKIWTRAHLKEAYNDFQCLIALMDEQLSSLEAQVKRSTAVHEHIYFHQLFHLFPVDSLIYVKDGFLPHKVWRVAFTTGGRKYLSYPENDDVRYWQGKSTRFRMDCYFIDFDGGNYVRVWRTFFIEPFTDTKTAKELPYLPLHFAEEENLISRQALEQRGKEFMECTSIRHLYYSGRSLDRTPTGHKMERPDASGTGMTLVFSETVESQVIVDFKRGFQTMNDWLVPSAEMKHTTADRAEIGESSDSPEDPIEDDRKWDTKLRDEFEDKALTEMESLRLWTPEQPLPDPEVLMLLPDRVVAFVLRTRTWTCLRIGKDSEGNDFFRDIQQRRDAWDDLEIPDGHKELVQSLIEAHFSKEKKATNSGFDLIRDKGKGVIVLLHGVPGVGKTSTAECVAETYRKPLLPITCGDLGLKAEDVESHLQSSFQLAQAWDCVLLLDEADVFLSKRKVEEVDRNALVSVFLRVLEYYEGILFLTTNRVGSFDEAFKSRIHMALYYPPLNENQTQKIWESQIRRAKERDSMIECDERQIIRFAMEMFAKQDHANRSMRNSSHDESNAPGIVWNGRQIRNAFQSAVALAKYKPEKEGKAVLKPEEDEKVVVTVQHFQRVAQVSDEFNEYLWLTLNGMTDAEVAKQGQWRYDDYGNPHDPFVATTPARGSGGERRPFGVQRGSGLGRAQGQHMTYPNSYHANTVPMQSFVAQQNSSGWQPPMAQQGFAPMTPNVQMAAPNPYGQAQSPPPMSYQQAPNPALRLSPDQLQQQGSQIAAFPQQGVPFAAPPTALNQQQAQVPQPAGQIAPQPSLDSSQHVYAQPRTQGQPAWSGVVQQTGNDPMGQQGGAGPAPQMHLQAGSGQQFMASQPQPQQFAQSYA